MMHRTWTEDSHSPTAAPIAFGFCQDSLEKCSDELDDPTTFRSRILRQDANEPDSKSSHLIDS